MSRFVIPVLLLLCPAFSPGLSAQVVDASVCDILNNPESFDGKTVRVKGEVIAGFEEFVIKGADCNSPVDAIWLSYPSGTKAKAGPAATLQFQVSKNNSSEVSRSNPAGVKLEKNKDFKEFDSLLSTPAKMSAMCLGCIRYTVTATLVGHLDGAKDAGVVRDAAGKFIGVHGFGNLNGYRARLVLQSVSEVASQEIDYAKLAASTKGDSQNEGPGGDPIAAAHQVARAFGSGPFAEQLEKAAAAYGKEGEHNGVEVGFGVSDEVPKNGEGKGDKDSPDGLLFNATFDMDRLKGNALTRAISHIGTHIADTRSGSSSGAGINQYELERRAWQTTVLSALGSQQKTLTLPGGYLVWNSAWATADRGKMVGDAVSDFLGHWACLKNSPSK
jgi:hypothetical protein